MRYSINLSELSLIELLDLKGRELFGLVQLDEPNARALDAAVEFREQTVETLEKCLRPDSTDPPGHIGQG